jgi:hypothetical protein
MTARYLAKYEAKRVTKPRARAAARKERAGVPAGERLWSPADVAEFLGVPAGTLQRWRYERVGPPVFKVGRHVRYDPDAVRRWVADECRQDWWA